jgi:arginyl-tRNA synthetase
VSTIALRLADLVRGAAEAAGFDPSGLPMDPAVPTSNPEHGDYQSNLAFRLAKTARMSPRAAAERLLGALPPSDLVATADVAGPGFLNFRVSDAALAADVQARIGDPRLGTPAIGAGKTLVIDFSSPNIAKRMHIGHLRSTIIGNAIDRLHRFAGWRVIADNHLGDWGTPFGKLIVAWHAWRDEAAFEADPVGELQRLYQLFGDRLKEDPALGDQAREWTAKLQHGEPATRALWKRFVDASLLEFGRMYARLGVRFDVMHGESFYEPRLPRLVEELLASGLAIPSEGAVVVPFSPEDGKQLANTVLPIRKRDGAFLYGTTDLATVEHRMATWSPDLIVIVVDGRQQLHFQQVFATARKMGFHPTFVHAWFGVLTLPGGEIASTRAGAVLNLVDVLDTAAARARQLIDEKSPDLPDDQRAAIAEAVGVGALKYFDLSQNPQTDIQFEWSRALAMDGNTAPYLMYAHARCRSLLRRAVAQGRAEGAITLAEPSERALALAVARTPDAILAAAANLRPNLLCEHLFGLAGAFSRFWESCRVLDDAIPAAIAGSRLSLARATAEALSAGLQILGVDAPDQL